MPLYHYACPRCGEFSSARPLADFDQPTPCVTCATPSPRTVTRVRVSRFSAERVEAGAHAAGCRCCAPGSARAG